MSFVEEQMARVDHLRRLAWMRGWAVAHQLTIELDGEVGFGRPCVGVIDRAPGRPPAPLDSFVAWDWGENTGPGTDAPDAYHKGSYLAVLVVSDREEAERQLYEWLHRLAQQGVTIERDVPKEIPDLGSLLGKNTETYVRGRKQAPHG